jgi:hypothetical protein
VGKPLENFAFATNSTIDFLAIDCLLDNLIEAATICGQVQDNAMWADMKTKIPPFNIGETGAIREYTNSAFIDRAANFGTSHVYGLWPLKNISFNNKVVLYQPSVAVGATAQKQQISLRQASFNALMQRLAASWREQDSRSIMTAGLQAAHAGLGNESAEAVRQILLRALTSVVSNSGLVQTIDWRGSGFTKNGDAQFDMIGNVGLMNLLTECVVQSNSKTLRILPCVFDALSTGKIESVVTDFAAVVSVDWDLRGKGKCIVKIVPRVTCKVNIEVNRAFRKSRDKSHIFSNAINGLESFQLVANRPVTLEFI